jgi:hypothetical protein
MTASREIKNLSSELQKLRKERDELHSSYLLSEKRAEELEQALKGKMGSSEFRKTLHVLKEETEKLRSVYPLQDLLAAKEVEVVEIGRALASVTEAHPEFESFDLKLRTHVRERDALRSLALKATERFNRQILRIRTAGLMVPFEVQIEDSKQQYVSEGESSEQSQDVDLSRSPLLSLLPTL